MRILFFSPSDPFKVGFFRMPKFLLRFLGIWPLDDITKFTAILIGINLIVLLTAIIGEIRFTWLIRREPIVALVAVCPCLTKVVTCFKLMSYLNYRKKFGVLLKQLQRHLYEDTKDSQKNSEIGRISFLTAIWSMWLLFIGLSANGFYTTKPIIFWTYQRYMGDNSSWISLPFQAALPYVDMTRVQDKGVYAFVFCFLAYSGNVNIFGFPAVDGAFMCFCMYISVSQHCLHEDFKRAFKNHTTAGGGDQRKSDGILYQEISRLVKRHQNVLLMFERLNGLYKFMIFGHFFFAAIVLGVVLLNVLLSSGLSKTVYVFYAIGASSQLYTYCYGAEMLNETCLKLCDTIYFCPWYKCDKKVQKLILFVMIKSQRGCLLQAPFFTPSLPLFGAIMKTSASYLTLLKAFL